MSTLAGWARFPEDDLTVATMPRVHSALDREPWLVALVSWVTYSVLGVILVSHYGVMGDALARVADAYYVLFSRDPHLASIGFVWNPLPGLLAVPLVALKDFWPALARQGVAASLVSAAFGGLAVFFFVRILKRLGIPTGLRWTVTALFALNPGVVYYAANGMTDLMMAATMLAAVDGLWGYLEERYLSDLLGSSLWLAVGFLIRYEVAFWAAIVAICLAFGLARLPLERAPTQRRRDWIDGLLVFWMAPLVSVAIVWVFLNWTIMGDALYFLQSSYGNSAQLATGTYAYAPVDAAAGNLGATLTYLIRQTLLFPPVVPGIVVLLAFGLAGRRERHVRALIVAATTLAIPLLQALLLYRGASAGWLRFFLSFIVFGFVAIAFGARLMSTNKASPLIWGSCLLLLVAGDSATYAMLGPSTPLHTESPSTFQEIAPVVAYLDAHPRPTVLTDSFRSFPIILRVQRPKQLVISSDRDFPELLARPLGQVDAFLVPRPTATGALDAVNRRYPELWEGREPWAELLADFPGGDHWRLYAIRAAPEAGAGPLAPPVSPEQVAPRRASP